VFSKQYSIEVIEIV